MLMGEVAPEWERPLACGASGSGLEAYGSPNHPSGGADDLWASPHGRNCWLVGLPSSVKPKGRESLLLALHAQGGDLVAHGRHRWFPKIQVV